MGEFISVMIVDDSRSVLMQLKTIIEEFDGVKIVGSARDGASAVRMASELRPDVILMDIVMPGMDGLAALRILKAQQPEIEIAMVSSVGGMPSRAEEAFRLGALQVVGKPFDKQILGAFFDTLTRTREEASDATARGDAESRS